MPAPLLARRLAAAALACAASAPLHADGPAAERRSVTVAGEGQVSAAPDRARLAMSVELTRPELGAAQAEASRITREYLAQARALGARDEDLSTAALSIHPEYDYSDKYPDGRRFNGYHVSQGIEVKVQDLGHVGDFVKRAIAAGVNTVQDPVLESSRAETLQREALAQAAADAKAKAAVLAEALGARLGPVHAINSAAQEAQPLRGVTFYQLPPKAARSANEGIGFVPGTIVFKASVVVDFDLLPP